jgi:esterase/lipase superfamily enzyme
MHLVRYGSRGPALIYIPSSGGDETEFERYGMIEECAPWIDAGLAQLFSIDGGGPRSLWNESLGPRERIERYAAFESYAATEVVPWVLDRTGQASVGVAGASYGAFMAVNLLSKHHARVSWACGLGGVYGLWHRLDGYHDDTVYFHTPLEYLPRLEDPALLDGIRATRGYFLYAAADDEWLDSTRRLEHVLRERSLPHRVEVWPSPAGPHERWWKGQLGAFLSRTLGSPPGIP